MIINTEKLEDRTIYYTNQFIIEYFKNNSIVIYNKKFGYFTPLTFGNQYRTEINIMIKDYYRRKKFNRLFI